MVAFFYLTFWTTLAPLVLFLQILLENLLKVFLQIVKGIWIRFREAFVRFENFLPLFQMLFLWLNQNPPLNEILLLVFKRVLIDTNWKYIEMLVFEKTYTNWQYHINWGNFCHKIPIEKTNIIILNFFEVGGAVLLLWA